MGAGRGASDLRIWLVLAGEHGFHCVGRGGNHELKLTPVDLWPNDLRLTFYQVSNDFHGDVGRPDLLASAGAGLSAAALARRLYRSLHGKLLRLPDATRVFPAHGAGVGLPQATLQRD